MRIGGLFARMILIAAILAAFTQPTLVEAQSINDLLKKQQQIQKQLEQSAKALETKKREASSIQDQIADLSEDLAATQARIRDTEAQIALTSDIVVRLTTQIDQQNQKLRKAYMALYELSRTSSATSSLFGDSLNETLSQAQYVQAIQAQLQLELAQLGEARSLQEQQKASFEKLNSSLESDRQYLASQRNRQSYLLSLNSQQQIDYEQAIKDLKQQQMRVNAQVAAYYASFAEGANYGGTGGYPWAGANPWVYVKNVKEWSCVGNGTRWDNSTACSSVWGHGFDRQDLRYYVRNCTSYAAWKWWSVYGVSLTLWGHAKNWTSKAQAAGYRVDSTPEVGTLVVWPGRRENGTDQWGHVAYVEAVLTNGNIVVSQYNAALDGRYSTQTKSSTWDNSLGAPKFIHRQ